MGSSSSGEITKNLRFYCVLSSKMVDFLWKINGFTIFPSKNLWFTIKNGGVTNKNHGFLPSRMVVSPSKPVFTNKK
jgi:hypothetical protein